MFGVFRLVDWIDGYVDGNLKILSHYFSIQQYSVFHWTIENESKVAHKMSFYSSYCLSYLNSRNFPVKNEDEIIS